MGTVLIYLLALRSKKGISKDNRDLLIYVIHRKELTMGDVCVHNIIHKWRIGP